MRNLRGLLLCWTLILVTGVIAQVLPSTFSGKVISVKDGDTIEVLFGGKPVKIRLAHVDTPEKGQPYGNNAKQFTSDFCYNRVVSVIQTDDPDRYGRLIALVRLDVRTLNLELVQAGLAWHFKKYSKDQTYAGAEMDARSRRVGLWSQPDPIAPWDWRAAGRR